MRYFVDCIKDLYQAFEVGLNDESSGTQGDRPMHDYSTIGFIDMQPLLRGQDQSTRSSAAIANR